MASVSATTSSPNDHEVVWRQTQDGRFIWVRTRLTSSSSTPAMRAASSAPAIRPGPSTTHEDLQDTAEESLFLFDAVDRPLVDNEYPIDGSALSSADADTDKIIRTHREKMAAESVCVICLGGQCNITTLCCGQPVHQNCFATWLLKSSTCMYCRAAFPPSQEGERLPSRANTATALATDRTALPPLPGPTWLASLAATATALVTTDRTALPPLHVPTSRLASRSGTAPPPSMSMMDCARFFLSFCFFYLVGLCGRWLRYGSAAIDEHDGVCLVLFYYSLSSTLLCLLMCR